MSQDLVKGFLCPDMKQERVVLVGMPVSAIRVALGIYGGINISQPEYRYILSISDGFLFQVMPSYLLGLFFSISAMPLNVGLLIGMVSSLVFGLWLEVPNVPAPFAGLFLNVIAVAICWTVESWGSKPEG